MTNFDPVQEAAALAEEIASKIKLDGGSLTPAYEAAEAAAKQYQAAHADLEQVLPATEEVGLGFSRGFPSGKAILRAVRRSTRGRRLQANGDSAQEDQRNCSGLRGFADRLVPNDPGARSKRGSLSCAGRGRRGRVGRSRLL